MLYLLIIDNGQTIIDGSYIIVNGLIYIRVLCMEVVNKNVFKCNVNVLHSAVLCRQ